MNTYDNHSQTQTLRALCDTDYIHIPDPLPPVDEIIRAFQLRIQHWEIIAAGYTPDSRDHAFYQSRADHLKTTLAAIESQTPQSALRTFPRNPRPFQHFKTKNPKKPRHFNHFKTRIKKAPPFQQLPKQISLRRVGRDVLGAPRA